MSRTLLDCFAAVTVINLPERRDRRRAMEAQLERAGLRVDGDRVHVFPAIRPDAAGDWPSLGARGCFLSHAAALKRARDRGDAGVLVLEDDCEFDAVSGAVRDSLLRDLPRTGWGIAYLGHTKDVRDVPGGTWVQTSAPIGLAHCYAVARTAFDPLIAFLDLVQTRPEGHPLGGPQHYDGALCMFRDQHPHVVTLLASPSLAHQRSSRSDITTRTADKIPVVREVVDLARSVKRLLSR